MTPPDSRTPYGVLTGDTLFIGDVGRPDLLASIGFTRDELAEKLYDSLHNKLMPLPDQHQGVPRTRRRVGLRQEPVHRVCGRRWGSSARPTTRCGRRVKEKFVELVTEGQPPAPGYFVYNAILNRKGRELLDEAEMPEAMSYDEVRAALAGGAILVDGRDPRSSPWVTSRVRSTSGWRAVTPSSPAR